MALYPAGFQDSKSERRIEESEGKSTHNDCNNWDRSGRTQASHPADFPVGSAQSRAAARALLSCQPVFIVDFGTLPISSPSYEEILRDWKDEGDRYTHEQMRDNTLFRCAVLKDSDRFRRIKASSTE
jgi:hypothetical protein